MDVTAGFGNLAGTDAGMVCGSDAVVEGERVKVKVWLMISGLLFAINQSINCYDRARR
jgi:hypothetical protein